MLGERGISNSAYPTETFLANHGWNLAYRGGIHPVGDWRGARVGVHWGQGVFHAEFPDQRGDPECQLCRVR